MWYNGRNEAILEPEGGMGMAGIGDFCGAYRKALFTFQGNVKAFCGARRLLVSRLIRKINQ